MEDKLYKYLNIYYQLPQGMKNVLGGMYKRLPYRIRYGKAYKEFDRLIQRSRHWTVKDINEYQWRQIEANVRHAYAHVPYYKKIFDLYGLKPQAIQNFDDFKKIPCLTKEDIKRHYSELIAQNVPKGRLLPITTGGTTGTPLTVCYEKNRSRSKEAAFIDEFWRRIGRLPYDNIAFIRGNIIPAAEKNNFSLYDPIKNRLMMSSFHLTEKNLPKYFEKLNRFSPHFLHVYPSSLTVLAKYMDMHGLELSAPPKAILLSSEKLYPWQVELFQKVFKCRLQRIYGLIEMAAFATDCDKEAGYHFWSAYSYVELKKQPAPDGPAKNGLYQIIGTTFHNRAMPLIRYQTDDLAVGQRACCQCGSHGLMANDIAGRKQEFFLDAEGFPITFIYADVPLWNFKDQLRAYQYVQANRGEVLLRIEASGRLNSADLNLIQKEFNRIYPQLELEIERVEKIERTQRGKFRYLIQNIPIQLD